MDVALELNKVNVNNREWPLTEIPISMKVFVVNTKSKKARALSTLAFNHSFY